MDDTLNERHLLEWDDGDVHHWLSNLGFTRYENQLREHRISGDVLCLLDSEGLKSIGISTIGQRLAILKAVYQLKLAQNIPIGIDHYVPPSEAPDRLENVTVEKLHAVVREQEQRLRSLEEDNRNVHNALNVLIEGFNNVRMSVGRTPSDGIPQNSMRRQTSFQWENGLGKAQKSPTKGENLEVPHSSPQRSEYDVTSHSRSLAQTPIASASFTEKARAQADSTEVTANVSHPKAQRQESSDNLKSFKVSLEDPTWKVLPAALKKYRINNDAWQNYAMFICFGPPGNRIERCLSYDEKPLLLFQKLKDTKKNPVFMLKHIKDIRSPIAVAQQKHAARKASSAAAAVTPVTPVMQGRDRTLASAQAQIQPPKLEVQDFSTSTPGLTSSSGSQTGWDLSSAVDIGRAEDISFGSESVIAPTASPMASTITVTSGSSHLENKGKISPDISDAPMSGMIAKEIPVALNGVSYAVAIYPYMAEQDDEFDVVVGDTFIILSRARGWWVVQRDPTGSGIVDADIVKQGWVPAGCLLETNVPVASAIAEATAAKGAVGKNHSPSTLTSRTPILPLSIISTSFPGVALMDYQKKGEEELDLVKDEALRVFKRYNHWSYAVKEEGGDRGWVPSWFIGKVQSSGNSPATPSLPSYPRGRNITHDDNQNQVSPMSSAFPAVQSRP